MAITLKAARINAGYNLRDAASQIGVSVDTLISWEKGKTFPDVPKITKIEKLYGFLYHEIIFFADSSDLNGKEE